MGATAFLIHNIDNGYVANDECVSDEGTVTTPRDGFRTHDDSWFCGRDLDELVYAFGKLGCLHVIRITAKRQIFPCPVNR